MERVPGQFKKQYFVATWKSEDWRAGGFAVQLASCCGVQRCCPPTALRPRLQMVGGAVQPAAGLRPMSEWHHGQMQPGAVPEILPAYRVVIGARQGAEICPVRSVRTGSIPRAQSTLVPILAMAFLPASA
jgi:hypothetical protein